MTKLRHLPLLSTLLIITGFSLNTYARPLVMLADAAGSMESTDNDPVTSEDWVAGTLVAPDNITQLMSAAATTGGNHVVIADCDSGVQDNGEIQAGIDVCVANATNHGKLVSCVTHYTRALERKGTISKDDRKAIKRCAAHSDIGKGNKSKGDI